MLSLAPQRPPRSPEQRMEGAVGHRALVVLLLCVAALGTVAAGDDGQDKFRGRATSDDLLSRLGRAAWETLETWMGSQPLHLVAEVSSAPHGAIPGDTGEAASRLSPAPHRLLNPLLSPQSLSATFWIVSSGVSVALTMLCGILGDLLAATGFTGELRSPPRVVVRKDALVAWPLGDTSRPWHRGPAGADGGAGS